VRWHWLDIPIQAATWHLNIHCEILTFGFNPYLWPSPRYLGQITPNEAHTAFSFLFTENHETLELRIWFFMMENFVAIELIHRWSIFEQILFTLWPKWNASATSIILGCAFLADLKSVFSLRTLIQTLQGSCSLSSQQPSCSAHLSLRLRLLWLSSSIMRQ